MSSNHLRSCCGRVYTNPRPPLTTKVLGCAHGWPYPCSSHTVNETQFFIHPSSQ